MTSPALPLSSVEGFMPHGMCLLWQPNLLLMHVISDGLIAFSYYSIPVALIYFVVKRKDLSFRWLFVLFGLFILACGTTHLFKIWTIWHPDYFIEGLSKVVTAAISITTAIMIWPFIPIALKLPSPKALANANALLQEEVLEKQKHENEVKLLNEVLEKKVEERTQALIEANRKLRQEIKERQQAEYALQDSEEQLNAIVESAADGIITIDQMGTIESVNVAIESIFGYSKAELSGQDVACLIPGPDHDRHADYLAKYRETGVKKMINTRREAKGLHKDGHEFPLDIAVTEFYRNGQYFFTAIIRDITERKQVEHALRESRENFIRAQEVGILGWWRMDTVNNVLTFSDESYRIFGLPVGAPLTYESFLSTLHPDERENVQASWAAALKGENYDIEYRIIANHAIKWVRAKCYLEFNEEGSLLGGFGIVQDVTERKQAEIGLQEADRQKNEFLAMLGHELRNPLTPISNIAQTLGKIPLSEAAMTKASEMLNRNVNHITRLVDDLLDVSRITRGLVELERHLIELGKLIEDTAESIQPQINSKQQTLKLHLPLQPIYVNGDLVRLNQVFNNLLINASKYTRKGGRIDLRANIENQSVVVRVQDNGMGIKPELLPHIFNLFTQGERGLARSEGGLGLGLTLVKKLVDMHGGEVTAYSRGANQGSEFVVKLPTLVDASAEAETAPSSEFNEAIGQGLRILMIDDNEDVMDSISSWLEREGHQVKTANTGEKGILIAQSFIPDIILLDIGLPEMDGYQVAKKLREQSGSRKAKIVAISGYSLGQDHFGKVEADFDNYLLKPPKLNELQSLILECQR
jgi:PAS domain S-box-containing protein